MKVGVIAVLVASVSAIRLTAPNDSYQAKNDSVSEASAAIAFQKKFEADHFAMHTDNMNTAESECQTLKSHVRYSRAMQESGGNQYPNLKTY